MKHRKTPCDCCNSKAIDTKHKQVTLMDGSIKETYEERCGLCENLLYGYAKTIK